MQIHSIELTNHCNLKCAYCPNESSSYPKGYLKLEHYVEALKHVIDGKGVGLSLCGESLLHPDLCSFVRIAVDNGVTPGLNTNGLLLTKELAKELVDAGLTKIEISLHTKKSYKNYEMMYNLKLPIEITANVLTCNQEEVEECAELPLRIQPTHNWARDYVHDPSETCMFRKHDWCSMRWDGNIVACCYDFDGKAVIGHIDNFGEIKHKPYYELCKTCSPSWVVGAL